MLGRQIAALACFAACAWCAPTTAPADGPQAPDSLVAAQQAALAKLAFMDGVWRGPAWTILTSGKKHDITQTERIGPFLGGAVKVIEGRGYDAEDGHVSFNALGIVSYAPDTQAYTLHSYAQGRAGDFTLARSDHGYVWEIPAGPVTIRYTATITDSTWLEVGDRVLPGKDPFRFFEMNLKRVGKTDWPAAGAIPAQ